MILKSGGAVQAASGSSGRGRRRAEPGRAPKSLTTSLVDIDVALTDIVFHRQGSGLDGLGDRRPSSVVDYAIEGVVRPAAPAREDDNASVPLLVYVSGYEESDRLDRDEDFDQRSICYIATDRRSDYSWRTDIYIERHIFRRLVELYASKRIDSARISVLLKVLRDSSGAVDLPTSSHPMLRTAGDRYRPQSRAHLMSVQTSLAGATQERAHALFGAWSTSWGARLGRRQKRVHQL
jgi:hypothetical protein